MHISSYNEMHYLLGRLAAHFYGLNPKRTVMVLDLGSRTSDPPGLIYKKIANQLKFEYTGLDISPGNNVDVVPEDPYKIPVETESFDIVISGQAFEHIEFPWLTIKEVARVLKPGGYAIIIAPSSGREHRSPVDCWRIYPDGMAALAKWAGMENVYSATSWDETRLFLWGDTVGMFFKPPQGGSSRDSSAPKLQINESIYSIRHYTVIRRLYIFLVGILKSMAMPWIIERRIPSITKRSALVTNLLEKQRTDF
ncbi:MAG: methyltransferase domain-containing protein [Nitrospinae bacterium]|nr:methyltransferase domain-containing protein [Nitrospinota bacterium]